MIMAWKLPGDRTGHQVGSGRTLNDGQAARLRTILNEKSPEEVGIASPLWTRKAVAELIRKEYGIDMRCGPSASTSSGGATLPRCRTVVPRIRTPEEVHHWLEVTYPAIEARAAREDAEIHWCDETGAGGRPATATGLRPRGAAGEDQDTDPTSA